MQIGVLGLTQLMDQLRHLPDPAGRAALAIHALLILHQQGQRDVDLDKIWDGGCKGMGESIIGGELDLDCCERCMIDIGFDPLVSRGLCGSMSWFLPGW